MRKRWLGPEVTLSENMKKIREELYWACPFPCWHEEMEALAEWEVAEAYLLAFGVHESKGES